MSPEGDFSRDPPASDPEFAAAQPPGGTASPTQATGYARYRNLKANVRRRRGLYKVILILAVLLLLFTFVDILVLDSVAELGVLGAYVALLIWAILMLVSTQRTDIQLADIDRLQRTLLQCPECKNVFQYGEIHFDEHRRAAFTCPICGTYGALPEPGSEPVKAVVPEGDLKVRQYVCANCREEIEVGTYGEQPLYDVRFRTCPRCGQSKFIQKKPEAAPRPVNPT